MMGCIPSKPIIEADHTGTSSDGGLPAPLPVLLPDHSPGRDPIEHSSSPNENQSHASTSKNNQGYGPRRFTFKELAIATDHFSNNFLLGEGGFGQVYRGSIDGKFYAIKKLKKLPDEHTEAAMEDEIKIISSVRHRNLVELIGYCIEGANKLLVLEFLPNKSLKSHLHGKEGNKILEWSNRMKIAVGSAKGLKYLHEDCKDKIIHRDIKTDNIVLDNNFEPKVTDFGLSLFFPENVTHISKSIKGTEVYVDPEYSGRVSYKSDVYSFGVVLLELIAGRQPNFEGTTIVDWAKTRIKQALKEEHTTLVDFRLSKYDKKEMNRIISCAAACLYKPLESRPSMNQIVQALEDVIPLENIWDENDNNFLHSGRPQHIPQLQSTAQPEPLRNGQTPPNGLQKLEKLYTYKELADATGDFSNNNLLGEGGFGQVFKGKFPDGEVVAIKKLKFNAGTAEMEGAKRLFEFEIRTISRIRHRNLVEVLGYCSDKADTLFVCEFVPNKSLRYHLQGKENKIINWSNRMKIAKGSAKGLAYLHEECTPRIIHRDIKSENILLDNNFEPKIADFGLAKDFLDSQSHVSSKPRGTFGYSAPEYVNDERLTDKSDVFSFGVVLLELITGKLAVEKEGNVAINLAIWAVPLLKEALRTNNYKALADSKLQDYDDNEMTRMIYCAVTCVYKPEKLRPEKLRPKMSQIVEVLQGNMAVERIWVSGDTNFLYNGAPYLSLPDENSDFNSTALPNTTSESAQETE